VSKQLNLFGENNKILTPRKEKQVMGKDALSSWKSRIFDYQQKVRTSEPPVQTSLFNVAPSHWDADAIDPFELRLHTSLFYELPDWGDESCIYFIIDCTLPLLLYIGETKSTPKKRWMGVHDCKDYILNYIELHRKYKLDVAVGTAFEWGAPADRKTRQQLERDLILRWRSPFNKECWERWGQPFGKI
jgi:hypothetical protein